MPTRMTTLSLLVITLVAMGIVSGCQTDLERAAEATVQVQQQNIEDFFSLAEEKVMAAVERAGDLPSQEFEGNLIVQDLEEIQRRLSDAVEQESEAKVAALEAIQEQIATVQANIEDAIQTAVSELPEETQEQLDQLQSDLEDLQQRIQDEIDAVREDIEQAAEDVQEAVEEEVQDAQEAVEEAEEEATPSN